VDLRAFDKDFAANADEFDLVASPSNTPPVASLCWKPKLNQGFLILREFDECYFDLSPSPSPTRRGEQKPSLLVTPPSPYKDTLAFGF
jgi:hypothetical protein